MTWWRDWPGCPANRFAWLQCSDDAAAGVSKRTSTLCAWYCLPWCIPSSTTYTFCIVFKDRHRKVNDWCKTTSASNMFHDFSQPKALTRCFMQGENLNMVWRSRNYRLLGRPLRYSGVSKSKDIACLRTCSMWVRQISSICVTNKVRINPRTIRAGNTGRFTGIEQAQIRNTLEVAENVFNIISMPACGRIDVSSQCQ